LTLFETHAQDDALQIPLEDFPTVPVARSKLEPSTAGFEHCAAISAQSRHSVAT